MYSLGNYPNREITKLVNRVVPLAEWREASLRYAKRLSLILPEALFATKRAVNRGADAAGFRTAPLRRAQRCRSALRDENGIRHKIPRHRVSRKCPRRRQMARRAVQGLALFGRRQGRALLPQFGDPLPGV